MAESQKNSLIDIFRQQSFWRNHTQVSIERPKSSKIKFKIKA